MSIKRINALVFSVLLGSAIFLMQLPDARAADANYTISEKSVRTSKSGQIHGIFRYCILDAISQTEIYIPGTSFRVKPNSEPDLNYFGEFNIHYVPAGIYSLVFDFPNSKETVDYQIDDVEVLDGYITEFDLLYVCRDQDDDGYAENRDCRDDDPLINPNATEICRDNIDNNCNGIVNENCKPCVDADNDGFKAGGGLQGDGTIAYCGLPRDCNDENPLIRPIENEVCDNLDNNCNGQIDEGFDLNTDSNCGACGLTCVYPDTCVAGVCSNQ